jgi:Mn-dependent DtxR family transcriptional regulator
MTSCIINWRASNGIRTAAADTEGIEHHVSPQTLEKLAELTKKLRQP